ncbi:MAG: hypothetical protein L6437_12740 [Kiritimatiellae bacterium]|nr:hypothetical protein [Kiritimatiellia bacterium]
MYTPGETAKFEITVRNAAKETFKGRIKVGVIYEMEDGRELLEVPLEIAAGETKKINAEWKNLPEVLGCEVKADITDPAGKTVATGMEYFNICRHLDSLRVGIHSCAVGLPTYGDEAHLKEYEHALFLHQASYVNIGEYFVGKSTALSLAPEGEDEYPGADYWNSNKAVKFSIDEMHKRGLKGVVYVTSISTHGLDDLDYLIKHPEWIMYNEYGQPDNCYADVEREDKHRFPEKHMYPQPGPFCSVNINWMDKGLLDHHIDQLIANNKMFGMDGVRYDGHPGSQWGKLDVTGKLLPTGEERRKAQYSMIKHIKNRVKKSCPDYLFMFNHGVVSDYIDAKGELHPAAKEALADGGAWCDEELREANASYNRFNSWEEYTKCLMSDVDLARANGGYAYLLFPYTSTVHKNSDEIGYSIMFATGNHVWWGMPKYHFERDPGGCHYPIQKNLYAFATRFSAMLWGHGIERIKEPEGIVNVESDKGKIWWKQFVHRRKLKDGREYVIVHLINAPPNKNIGVTEQPLPEPIDNVKIKFKIPVKKAWLATARPGSDAKEEQGHIRYESTFYSMDKKYENYMPMQYGEASYADGVVTVPQLKVWTMVVGEVSK